MMFVVVVMSVVMVVFVEYIRSGGVVVVVL